VAFHLGSVFAYAILIIYLFNPQDATIMNAVHAFAGTADIPLTPTASGGSFKLITPDFMAEVPVKAKSEMQFARALFSTNLNAKNRPKKTDIVKDMEEVTSPPESPPSSASTSPSKLDAASDTLVNTLPIVFELTTIVDDTRLEKKLDQIERVLHYLIHAKLSPSAAQAPSVSVLLDNLTELGAIAGFGVPSLSHCSQLYKLLENGDVMTSRPCVKHLHATGGLYFFVCIKTVHSEMASNSSDISSMKRQLEQMGEGQKQMEAKVDAITKLIEQQLAHN
jgi:hypothetical protein